MQPFAAADINNVRIGGRNFDCADGACWLLIKDGLPGPPEVVGLPHTAIHRAHIEDIRLARHTGDGARAPAAKRTDIPPLHLGEELGIDDVNLRTCWRRKTEKTNHKEAAKGGTILHHQLRQPQRNDVDEIVMWPALN